MATSKNTIDYLLDQLTSMTNLTARRMFGEYCIYLSGKPIGFVCDDQLYIKVTTGGRSLAPQVREGFPYSDAKAHLLITEDLWEDRDWLAQLIQVTANELPPIAEKKKKIRRASEIFSSFPPFS